MPKSALFYPRREWKYVSFRRDTAAEHAEVKNRGERPILVVGFVERQNRQMAKLPLLSGTWKSKTSNKDCVSYCL